MIYLIRASHANIYELQNYAPLVPKLDITVVTSRHPLTPAPLPTISLWSPTDLPHFPYRRQLLNRLVGGQQWLVGLEQLVQPGDTLHTAETYTPYTHQAVQLRKEGRVGRLICTCWETIAGSNEKFGRLRQWKKEAYRYIDLFHTPTERAAQALIAEGVPRGKIMVIPYGVDRTHFRPAKVKTPHAKPRILTVGRPVREKGYQLFQRLEHKLSEVATFSWVYGVPYQDMPAIYQSADIFLLPSLATPTWEEQYGMVLVEAMACGLPIVATDTGAIREVVGDAGILVKPTLSELSQVLTRLIHNQKQRSHLSQLVLKRAEQKYDSLRQSRLLHKLYLDKQYETNSLRS